MHNVEMKDARHYNEYCITGYLDNSYVNICLNYKTDFAFIEYDKVCEVHIIDIKDYNKMFGKNVVLADLESELR